MVAAAQRHYETYLGHATDKLSRRLDTYFDTMNTGHHAHQAQLSRAPLASAAQHRDGLALFSKYGAPKFSRMQQELRALEKGLYSKPAQMKQGSSRVRKDGQADTGLLKERDLKWLRFEKERSQSPLV
eukprot:Tamp_39051.p1 GENE.Tamp_39051~~Tamp_39051.p1  ORF type:complete len:150 (+),score=24.77 Tamp_39051:69-452(+)